MNGAPEWLTVDRMAMMIFIFNALVQALPEPLADSSRFYVFIYKFAHFLAANLNVVRKPVRPQKQTAEGANAAVLSTFRPRLEALEEAVIKAAESAPADRPVRDAQPEGV